MEKTIFLRTVFHNTGTGMATIEEGATIFLVNKEMENFLGYARHEMEGFCPEIPSCAVIPDLCQRTALTTGAFMVFNAA